MNTTTQDEIILLVAIDANNAIGKDNDLPWERIPEDMAHFRDLTVGEITIMGRKTFDSFPKKFRPLPGRENVIVSRNPDVRSKHDQVYYMWSLEDAIAFVREAFPHKKKYLIGGAEVYKQAIEKGLVDTMMVTHLDIVSDADTFFHAIDLSVWEKVEQTTTTTSIKTGISFFIATYKKKNLFIVKNKNK